MKISRRDAMQKLSAGALLSLGLWPGALRAFHQAPGGAFRFLVMNDLHYMTPECGHFLEGVVRQMKQHQPEFCILAGDLTEKGKREHLAAVKEIFSALGCPVFTAIGNHDYNAPHSNRYYRLFFPRRLNYWFDHRGWQFVGLDTTQGQDYEKTKVQPDTLAWVRDHLRDMDPQRPTVLFTHFPLAAGVKYRPLNADDLLEPFQPFNLQTIYCGHFHGHTKKAVLNTVAYTGRCCALKRSNHDNSKEKGYLLCSAADGRVETSFVPVTVPKPSDQAPRG